MTLPTSMQYSLYLPRVLLGWLASGSDQPYLEIDGTLVFSDISGFTALTERLAEKGKEGAEEVTTVLNGAFTELLNASALEGGDLIKFGGDALLLLFSGEGHAARAAVAAFDMRDALEDYQESRSPTPLTMSVGLASGPVQLFIAGDTSREVIVAGPTATTLTEMEGTAESGDILLAPSTAELIDDFALGDEKGGGVLLEDAPDADEPDDDEEFGEAPDVDLGDYVSSRLRKHLSLGFNEGEHRFANIAFVKVEGFDSYLEANGSNVAQADLDAVVKQVQAAADHYAVTFLQTDISADGVKMMLASGVPERADRDRERMLRTLDRVTSVESPFEIHVGAAHGSVFAGDLGARTRRVYTVMGDTVNLAARLASAAEARQVLVTEEFDDVHIFETTPLEPVDLKGKSKPVIPYLLGGPLEADDAAAQTDLLPLIGRDEELTTLTNLVEEAAEGSGSIVTVVGAAGTGKTRLLQEVRDRAADAQVVVANCEPYESNTAFFALGQLVRNALNVHREDEDPAGRLTEILIGADPELAPWVPLVARVAGISMDPTPEVEALDAKFQETKTAEVIGAAMAATLEGTVIAFIDGAQWIDDASQSLLDHLVPTISAEPWVVVASSRVAPEDESAQTLNLEPLDAESSTALAVAALGDQALPAPVIDAIVSRSGGNPFFLLELVGSASEGDGQLPTSVEAAVAARIDHLQVRDRRLLGYAAVLGQQFSLDLMADALPDASVDDTDAWQRLAEFLETSLGGKVRFRQPIVRDVAYEGLPFERRRQLHEAIGEALERRARKRPERFAELLSLHFDLAGVFSKAWEYSVMAAERARRKYANVDAAELYRRALDAEDSMEGEAPPTERAQVAEALGDVTEVAGLYGKAEEAFLEAQRIFGEAGV
ncbi:MAG: DUF2791 family P-loop domain-containing protein, partial [Acidimicrobiia bacterium]|nr:DUF2791 family P-loop domain-containing protein [Acidimicrobiia bacterium]